MPALSRNIAAMLLAHPSYHNSLFYLNKSLRSDEIPLPCYPEFSCCDEVQ
jgi:hypothetical protein